MAGSRLARRFSLVPRRQLASQACPLGAEWAAARPFTDIPGPKPLPLLGNVWRFLPGIGTFDFTDLIKLQKQLNDEYGDVVRFSGLPKRNDLLFIFDPEDIAKVFRHEGLWPERPALQSFLYYRKVTRRDFFEGVGGVLLEQGREWQEARSQVNPVLLQPRTVHLYTERINQVAQDFVDRVPEWRGEGNQLPGTFKNEIHKWALESIAVVALDTRLGCLAPGLAPDSEPQRMIDAVHTVLECSHVLDIGSGLWKVVSTPTWRKFVRTMDYFVDVSMKYVTLAMERSKQKGGVVDEEASVLEKFLARDPNPKRAVVMALDMIGAGVDTTSHTLTNALLHLSANPAHQEKLFSELRRVLPRRDTPVRADTLGDLAFLRACLKESMRMEPTTTGNARTTREEIVLSNYQVPKGVDIVISSAHISRLEKHFPQADKFIPERWLREGGAFPGVKPNPYVSMPFGHGARKCVGMRFAQLELEVLLAKLVRNFRWEFHHPKMRYRTTLLSIPVDPLKFTVHLRED